MSLPVIYTIPEAAKYLGVGTSTVQRAIEDGRLRASTVGRRNAVRITERALLEFLGEAVDSDPTPPRGIERPAVVS